MILIKISFKIKICAELFNNMINIHKLTKKTFTKNLELIRIINQYHLRQSVPLLPPHKFLSLNKY